jgi:anti-sigma B factor antagonist
MEQPGGQIQVGLMGKTVMVRVHGRATHQHAQRLREFSSEMVGRGYRLFEVDLGRCTYMDSTFLGVLVGISLQLERSGEGSVSIFSITHRNLELLRTLGVDRFFKVDAPGRGDARVQGQLNALPEKEVSKMDWAGTVLEAHQILAQVDERNQARFKDLLDYMREDLEKAKLAAPGRGDAVTSRWKQ